MIQDLLELCESMDETNAKVQLASKISTAIILCGSIKENQEERNTSVTMLYKSIKDLGIETYMLNPNDLALEEKNGEVSLLTKKGEKIKLNPSTSYIFYRRSAPESELGLSILQKLELLGFICVNPYKSIELCNDKYLSYTKLIEDKIATPKTALITANQTADDIKDIIEKDFKSKFPLIIKVLDGSKGKGVVITDSLNSAISTIQALLLSNPKGILIQEFIKNTGDYRVHVVNGKVVASMKRESGSKEEFRANISLGGKGHVEELDQEIIDLAIKANKSVNGIWTGVDIIIAEDSKKPYVIEINASPGLIGITEATKTNIVKMIIDQLEFTEQSIVTSVFERISIEGIGEFECLLDTGNMKSSMSLDAKDIEVDEENHTVKYTVGTKEYKDPLVKMIKVKDNNFSDKSFRRPVIQRNVIFKNKIYKDILIDLNNRSHKNYKVLVNLDFMKLAKIKIDPSK